jgi:hypothetical protein
MSGGRNVAAETRTQKCGIICGENVIEQFEIGMSAKRRFAMGSGPIVLKVLSLKFRTEDKGQKTKALGG